LLVVFARGLVQETSSIEAAWYVFLGIRSGVSKRSFHFPGRYGYSWDGYCIFASSSVSCVVRKSWCPRDWMPHRFQIQYWRWPGSTPPVGQSAGKDDFRDHVCRLTERQVFASSREVTYEDCSITFTFSVQVRSRGSEWSRFILWFPCRWVHWKQIHRKTNSHHVKSS